MCLVLIGCARRQAIRDDRCRTHDAIRPLSVKQGLYGASWGLFGDPVYARSRRKPQAKSVPLPESINQEGLLTAGDRRRYAHTCIVGVAMLVFYAQKQGNNFVYYYDSRIRQVYLFSRVSVL